LNAPLNLYNAQLQKLKANLNTYKSYNQHDKIRFWRELLINWAIYIMIVIFMLYITLRFPRFLSGSSIVDIIQRTAAYGLLALGQAGIIVLAGVDLSAGRMLGLMAVIAASLEQSITLTAKMYPLMNPWNPVLVLLLLLTIGTFLGFLNGFFIARFKVSPFIVTLAMSLMIYGFALMYLQLGSNQGRNISGMDARYTSLIRGSILRIGNTGIPNYVLYFIAFVIIMWIVWNKTSLGKNMYAVGGNPEAAIVSGISVFWTTALIFTIAGLLYGFSAFVEAARVGSNTAATGLNYELDAIAACVIGGVSFTGGVGTIGGVVTGVVLLQLISIGLQWLGVAANLTYVIKGLIILIVVVIDTQKTIARR
jgi:methyl-galactoside transport system permease protein